MRAATLEARLSGLARRSNALRRTNEERTRSAGQSVVGSVRISAGPDSGPRAGDVLHLWHLYWSNHYRVRLESGRAVVRAPHWVRDRRGCFRNGGETDRSLRRSPGDAAVSHLVRADRDANPTNPAVF